MRAFLCCVAALVSGVAVEDDAKFDSEFHKVTLVSKLVVMDAKHNPIVTNTDGINATRTPLPETLVVHLAFDVKGDSTEFVLDVNRVQIHADRYQHHHLDTEGYTTALLNSESDADVNLEEFLIPVVSSMDRLYVTRFQDCFYHGTLRAITTDNHTINDVDVGDVQGVVALSLCRGGMHAQLWVDGEFIEIAPSDASITNTTSRHMVVHERDLKEKGQCGVVDDLNVDRNENDILDRVANHFSTPTTTINNARRNANPRRKRQTCVKTVDVVLFNDESMHNKHGELTEYFTSRIFNAVVGTYDAAAFDCEMRLQLVGQVTFRHGLPPQIVQKSCEDPFILDTIDELYTNVTSACCAATDPCDVSCSADTTTSCLKLSGTATYSTDVGAGCYSPMPSMSSKTCVATGAIVQTYSMSQPPELQTTSGNNVGTLLTTFGNWVIGFQADLFRVFGGKFDVSAFITAEGFGMGKGIVGLAHVTMSCSSPSRSVNWAGNSIGSAAHVLAHEMGHNFGLPHAVKPQSCVDANGDTVLDELCAGGGIMGSGTPNVTGVWTQISTNRMNSIFRAPTSVIRLAGGIYGDDSSASQGRLQLLVNGTWGNVCADTFGRAEAEVTCASLGMKGGTATPIAAAPPVVVSNVQCSGSETVVTDCTYSTTSVCPSDVGVVNISCSGVSLYCSGSSWIGSSQCEADVKLIKVVLEPFLPSPDKFSLYCDVGGSLLKTKQMTIMRNAFKDAFGGNFNGSNFYGTGFGMSSCGAAVTAISSRLGGVPPSTDNKACMDGWRDEHTRPKTFCGDGILEAGETCDPGIGSGDTCCTDQCTLAPSCDCPNTDLCCENGKFSASGTVCRTGVHVECDQAETCTGTSSDCPIDQYEPAGTNCTKDQKIGKCFNKECLLPHEDELCARFFPTRPVLVPTGNCGDGVVRCGTCSVWCKAPDAGVHYSNGYVGEDGVPCGDGKQCYATSKHNGTSDERGVVECTASDILNLPPSTAPPTMSPTSSSPTMSPTMTPTLSNPTSSPSVSPTTTPTSFPTQSPTAPSVAPSVSPTTTPTSTAPSKSPLLLPSTSPSMSPVPITLSASSTTMTGAAVGIGIGVFLVLVVVIGVTIYWTNSSLRLKLSRFRGQSHVSFQNTQNPSFDINNKAMSLPPDKATEVVADNDFRLKHTAELC